MLLVAVDPQGCAWQVVEQAATLARDLGDPVTLMTAVELPEGVAPDVEMHGGEYEGRTAREVLRSDAREALSVLTGPFEAAGVQVRLLVCEGACVQSVLDAADELNPRLLVLGTHGRTGLKRMVLGSVAEQILRRSKVPVVTVRSLTPVEDHQSVAQTAVQALGDG